MIVGTAGHIDHGKTSLVRALTGIETDRLQEERTRGISIELGYAYVPVESRHVEGPAATLGFVDVPAMSASCIRWWPAPRVSMSLCW
ncbi:GTP-binding protein [Stenotrophomonas sp. CD2]|nr:GTP-binding protein [Stenotrophomonas sp. CD2]